jgi:hypothetical protein
MLRGVRRAAILVASLICLAAPATAGAKQLTRYDVGGGLAGRYDRLMIDGAGHAVQTGDSGDHRFTISPRQLRALKAARFRTLKRQYKPRFQVFDGTVQSVRYRGKAVSIYSGADNIPKRLTKVIRRLARLMR